MAINLFYRSMRLQAASSTALDVTETDVAEMEMAEMDVVGNVEGADLLTTCSTD